MTNISKKKTKLANPLLSAVLIGVVLSISITIPGANVLAHKPNPASPPECSPNVQQPKTGHFVSIAVAGDDVTATAGVTEAGTGSNRVAFLLFDSAGNLVSGPVRVHRDAQPPASWSVSTLFSDLAPGKYTVVACFESPNNPNVPPVGVTHHVDSARLEIVPPGCESATTDFCIDGDGIATPGRGAFTAVVGNALSTWPSVGVPAEGIDSFNHPGGVWSNAAVGGSDIHLEAPGGACATALRDAIHQSPPGGGPNGELDCVVLDLDASLFNGQPVECDFEGAIAFISCPPFAGALSIKFIDANGDGGYNNGEDIIQDVNGNGIFD